MGILVSLHRCPHMHENAALQQHRFTYERTLYDRLGLYLFLGLLPSNIFLLILAVIKLFNLRYQGGWGEAGTVIPVSIATAAFFVPFAYVLGYLSRTGVRPDIVIDEFAISRYTRGKLRRTIPWSEVRQIRVGRFVVVKPGMLLYMVDSVKNPHPKLPVYSGLSFSGEIQDLPRLIELLNSYARRYHIPLIDIRHDAKTLVSSLPLP